MLEIKGLIEAQQYERARSAAQALLAEVPENRDVLYMLAVSQRLLQRLSEALATLARLEQSHPHYGRLFQERGHCLAASGQPAAALDSYLQAVRLNAALPAAWKALEVLFRAAGKTQESKAAADHVARLAALPAAVISASNLLADGEIHEARRMLCEFLRTHAEHAEALRLQAQIEIRLDALDEAESLLRRAVAWSPEHLLAHYDYVRLLLLRHRHALALEQSRQLLQRDPGSRDFQVLYASACAALGEYAEAVRVFAQVLSQAPELAEVHLAMGHALKTLGRQQQAVQSYRMAAQIAPGFGDAYWSLANLKTYRFADDEIALMRAQESGAGARIADRYHLCFALGKALEDRAQYAESFQFYERGNLLKRSEIHYQAEITERDTRLQIALFTREFIDARRGTGCHRPDPIFIVGMPRSGSTLVEQILASHSQVEATMELADIPRLTRQLQGRSHTGLGAGYPRMLAECDAEQLRGFGARYLADTQIYRSLGRPFFIDKMPNNFMHIGLIHLMLPNAKIIDARRHAMPCCFSNFKQLFAAGQEFSYSFEDLARYYRSYLALMSHWDAVLPGWILRLQHEQLVEDLEGNVRRMLAFCGLPFEPQCLEFYKTERSIRTPSSAQVRRPIYKEGLDSWRCYEPWLQPLRQALGAGADS